MKARFIFGAAILSLLAFAAVAQAAGTEAVLVGGNGAQTVLSTMSSHQYDPIIVQIGVPVKWTLRIPRGTLNSCNNSLLIPAYGLEIPLKVGDNLIEFTPDALGEFPFSCWMDMIRSSITVVSELSGDSIPPAIPPVRYDPGQPDYEEIVISECCIPYEPESWTLESFGVSVLLPAEWKNLTDQVAQQEGGVFFLFGDPDGEAEFSIDFIAIDLSQSSYESLAEGLTRNGMIDVSIKMINGYKFICFTQDDGEQIGAVLPSLDGAITFYYAPAEDGAAQLLTAILSTFMYFEPIPDEWE